MAEWTTYEIGDIAQVFDGPHATPKKTDQGPWFLSISSLDHGRLNLSESAHLSEQDFVKWTRRVTPEPGDILFSYETRLGDAAMMPEGIRACLGRRMGLLRPKRSRVHPRFLLFAYLSPEFQEVIQSRKIHGATVDRIPLVELAQWPIRLPPLAEQEAIVEVLGVLDDKIAVNERIAATAEALLRSMYDSLSISTEGIRIDRLGRLIRDSVKPESLSGEEPYIGMEHMPRKSVWLNHWGQSSEVGSTKSAFKRGDVLFGKLRPYFHKVGLAQVDGICSTDIIVVRAMEDECRPWLLMALSSDEVVAHAAARSDGTRMPRANWADLAEFEVPWPGAEAVTRFAATATPLIDRVESGAAESRTLAALRDTLLPQLMSGKLRVRDAERIMEDAV